MAALIPEAFVWQNGSLEAQRAAMDTRLEELLREPEAATQDPLIAHEIFHLRTCIEAQKTPSAHVEREARSVVAADAASATALLSFTLTEDVIIADPHGTSAAAATSSLVNDWATHNRCNAFGGAPRVHVVPDRGGLAAGALQTVLAANVPAGAAVILSAERLLELSATLFELGTRRTPLVLHALTARAASEDGGSFLPALADVLAVRHAGLPILLSAAPQESYDMALGAHLAALHTRVPVLHAMDGVQLPSTIAGIEILTNSGLQGLVHSDAVARFGTGHAATTDDEAQVPPLAPEAIVAAVKEALQLVHSATGRTYAPFEYVGAREATAVVVVAGSGAPQLLGAVAAAAAAGHAVGAVNVRLLRPWSAADLAAVLPATLTRLVVLESTASLDVAESALYLDVAAALRFAQLAAQPELAAVAVAPDAAGLSPAMAQAVLAVLALPAGAPLPETLDARAAAAAAAAKANKAETSTNTSTSTAVCLYDAAAGGAAVSDRAAQLVRVLTQSAGLTAQALVEVDIHAATTVTRTSLCSSKPAGATTTASVASAALGSTSAPVDVLVVADPALLFLAQYRLLDGLAPGGTLLLRCAWQPDQLATEIPAVIRSGLRRLGASLRTVDTTALVEAQPALADAAAVSADASAAIEDTLLAAATLALVRGALPKWCLAGLRADLASVPGLLSGAGAPAALAAALTAAVSASGETRSFEAEAHTQTQGHDHDGHGHTHAGAAPVFVPAALAAAATREGAPVLDGAYLKLLAHLFGERVVLADASQTTSLFGEKYLGGDDAADAAATRVRTLFSGDATEFCYGIYLARLHHRQALAARITAAVQSAAVDMPPALRTALDQWLAHQHDQSKSRTLGVEAVRLLAPLVTNAAASAAHPMLSAIYADREHFARPSRWIVGGDDWARDIGFSGLHHVLASGENVNVLLPETCAYTQPRPELRAAGRLKKDVGLYAMNYGKAYVASIAVHASHAQAVQALVEADAFDGPSIVLAYAPRVTASGTESAGKASAASATRRAEEAEARAAVDTGLWPLFRWNPAREAQGREPFALDSRKLRDDLEAFVRRESDLAILTHEAPQLDAALTDSAATALTAQDAQLRAAARGGGRKIDLKLLVLYGSDSGNGASLASKMARKAELRGVADVRCLEANAVASLDDLAAEQAVVFVMATAGQGEMCGNAMGFWNMVRKAKGSLAHLRTAIFGLGDSHYWGKGTADSAKYFCKPAKDLDDVLVALSAAPVAPELGVGLGDDQHENGYAGAWAPWETAVFEALGVPPVDGEEDVGGKVLKDEEIKSESGYLRGHILRSLADKSTGAILPEDTKLTKFHGIYQQDNRDVRAQLEESGQERAYSFMVRVGIPGGVCTPAQYLKMDALCDSHANGALKLTTRQAFQLHGVLKWNLKDSIREINLALMDTLAACGDVCRNVMANPNPYQSEVHGEVLAFAQRISTHLKPRTTAYHEIWLDKKLVGGHANADVEPLYGASYLPRKFKVAIAVPPMNDVDVFAHCLGYIAVVEEGRLVGFNVTVGGGMGMTHGNTKTYPRLADVMGFCTVEQAVEVGEKVMTVQRDYGDRVNRKHARLKYTVDDHGVDWYRAQVEERCGFKLQAARPFKFESNGDRLGWAKGVDNKYHYTLYVENGRVRDEGEYHLRTGLRELAQMHTGDFRLTANQNIIIGGITPEARPAIEAVMQRYNMDNERYSGMRQNSMACVALPTCALAMAESERYLPTLVGHIEDILTRHHLERDAIVIRMTGCPNGCARPYVAEIALVGKAPGTYNLYLGGGFSGNRLAKIVQESVNETQILATLDKHIAHYARERENGEHFGDFCVRAGIVAPTLQGRLFHETDDKINRVKTPSGTTQIYW